MGADYSVVGAEQGFRAPSGDQESVRDSVHEDSASARIAAGQWPRPSFRHPHQDWFWSNDMPVDEVLTDNGPNFVSDAFAEILAERRIVHRPDPALPAPDQRQS